MIMNEIKNKIQLETINENKRKELNQKKKINWRCGMNFCITSIRSEKWWEGKEIKKRKVILGQTTPKQHTHVIRSGKGYRDKSNDVAESQLQPPKPTTHTAIRQQSGWRVQGMHHQLFRFAKTKNAFRIK